MKNSVEDSVEGLLASLAELLNRCDEGPWATRLGGLAADLAAAGDGPEREHVVRAVLRLYGGMGSFSDLVLQDRAAPRPEQATFDRMRTELFERARDELGGDQRD